MKAAAFNLLLACAVAMGAIGQASAANAAPQQGSTATVQNGISSGAEHSASADESNARNEDRKEATAPDVRTSRRLDSGRTFPRNRTSLTTGNHPKPTQLNHASSGPGAAVNMSQTNPGKLYAGATTKPRTQSLLPLTDVAVGGQHFTNRRNEVATSALGGPATTRRNTATINGSAMNRRHVN